MIDKMGEEFETAYVEEMVRRCGEGYRSSVLYSLSLKGQYGDYLHVTASQAFWAWQASRAALVIELPPEESGAEKEYDGNYVVGCQQGWNEMRDKAIVAIEAVGVRVKS